MMSQPADSTAKSTIPDRGYPHLAGEVRRSRQFDRSEVEQALLRFFELAEHAEKTKDWNPWASLFTEDALYVEHSYGVFRGQKAIRDWVVAAGQTMTVDLKIADQWHVIDNDLCIVFANNFIPDPAGGAPFNFNAVAVLCYAGDGQFCYEEDFYNPLEAAHVMAAGVAALSKQA